MTAAHTTGFAPTATPHLHLKLGGTLSKAMVTEVLRACEQAEDAGPAAVLLITLDGERPLDGTQDKLDVALVNQWERALRRIERLSAVTVSAAAGDIGGLGLAVLLCTDYRVADVELRLSLAHAGQPLLPGMVLYRLANQVGVQQARRMALFGRCLSASEAQHLGLVDEVSTSPTAAARQWIAALSGQDVAELAVRRRLILEAPAASYEDCLGTHLAACDRALRNAPSPEASPQPVRTAEVIPA